MLQDRLGLSERRACRTVGQHGSKQGPLPVATSPRSSLLREYLQVGVQDGNCICVNRC